MIFFPRNVYNTIINKFNIFITDFRVCYTKFEGITHCQHIILLALNIRNLFFSFNLEKIISYNYLFLSSIFLNTFDKIKNINHISHIVTYYFSYIFYLFLQYSIITNKLFIFLFIICMVLQNKEHIKKKKEMYNLF